LAITPRKTKPRPIKDADRAWTNLLKRFGITDVRFHHTKASFVTEGARQGGAARRDGSFGTEDVGNSKPRQRVSAEGTRAWLTKSQALVLIGRSDRI